ncbi:DegT/DnrJ/EryC1/StrS family aminotransferase [Candidatus Woesearchaeota archaeon]|nr:DegT/DnrJ/EryC1/StrS family aminotransferase [Candidatus Woesearchaeota archaeon]
MEEVIEALKALTGKKKVILTRRGNKAIKFSLRALRDLGKTKVLIQDQGGWITYAQYAKELGLGLIEIKTNYGLIDVNDLKSKANSKSILLINSMPGYFAFQDMREIAEISKKAGAAIINDASGSIGNENARIGDIIVGSFSKWKPVDAGYGGFIATNEDYFGDMPSVFSENFTARLEEKIKSLNQRVKFLKSAAKKVKTDLKSFKIIHKSHEGFNVVVKFSNDEEKEKILNYCGKNNLEYTLCPRYIRVNDNAVSIEVKRLDG